MSGCVCEGVSEISIWISRLIHRPSSVWVAPIKSIEGLKRTGSWKKREFVPSACFQAGPLVFSCTQPACVFSCSIMSDSCDPHGWLLQPARLFKIPVHGIFQVRILEWVLLFPSPGDPPDPGIGPASLLSPALAIRFFAISTTWEAHTQPWNLDYYQLSWLRAMGSDQTCTTGFP